MIRYFGKGIPECLVIVLTDDVSFVVTFIVTYFVLSLVFSYSILLMLFDGDRFFNRLVSISVDGDVSGVVLS